MENGWIKERSGDVRHLKTCDTVFVQYIQKPLTSVRDVKSIAQMKFTGKSGFLISATLPHPTSHFSFTLLFHFQKRSAWKLSLLPNSLCTFKFIQNAASLKCKQMFEQQKMVGCMNLKRCVRKVMWIFNFILCFLFCFPFCQCLQFKSAHQLFNTSREFPRTDKCAWHGWRWYTYNQIAEQQTTNEWRKTLSSILFCQKECEEKEETFAGELRNANGNAKVKGNCKKMWSIQHLLRVRRMNV